jgi:biopolymer transport protein ExbD
MEFKRRKPSHHHLEITPLVDVVFNLLLFFMLTSNLVREPAIRIILPQSKTADSSAPEVRLLSVTKNGELFLQDRRIAWQDLRQELSALIKDPKRDFVRIKADREASVGLLVRVIDEVRLTGIIHFSILTTQEGPGK